MVQGNHTWLDILYAKRNIAKEEKNCHHASSEPSMENLDTTSLAITGLRCEYRIRKAIIFESVLMSERCRGEEQFHTQDCINCMPRMLS